MRAPATLPVEAPVPDSPPDSEPTGRPPAEYPVRGIEALVAAELPAGEQVRRGEEGSRWLRHPPRDLFGIALSGGGIRSATFNLGVLQGLHELQLLRAFDYLSTVSGGGYLGSFWTAWRSRQAGREGRFPTEVRQGEAEPREIRHLREFSNFLAPRLGIFSYDTGRLLVTAVSSMLPSLLAALSVIALAMLAWVGAAWILLSPASPAWAPLTLLLGGTAATLIGFELAWLRRKEPTDGADYAWASLLGLALTAAAWLLAESAPGQPVAYAEGQVLPGLLGDALTDRWAFVFAPAAAWGSSLLVLVVLRWFLSSTLPSPRWQRIRRASDRVRSRLLLLTAGWTAVSALWFAGLLLEYHVVAGAPVTAGTGLGGVAAVLVAAFAKVQQLLSKEKNVPAGSSLLARLRPRLPQILAYTVVTMMVVGVVAAIVALGRPGGTLRADPWWVATGAGAAVLLVLLLMNPNEVGLHSFYRARLARAYPGASNDQRAGENRETEEVEGDDLPLPSLAGGALRPFPLVCCAANDITSRDDMANLSRGAASAVLSPVGCAVDGRWAPWSDYRTPVSLGAAITASGAAFNTLMGSHSRKLGPAVTFLAAALNLRLGLWLPHPAAAHKRHWLLPGWPFFREMFGLASATGRSVHLSDGGHFENMAVYELIRRHCRVVLACDCGQDVGAAFDDLGNLVRRVREDFGVDVRIDTRPLRPGPDGLSRQHMVAGDIHYPDGDTGVLLLFKPSLVGDEPADVQQYRTRNTAFPHESTGDQFYDEAQWESYRRLGEHAVHSAFQTILAGLQLHRSGRSDQALREVWGDAFARARREWFPEPEGYEARLARFSDRVAELDALLRQDDCRLLLGQVYKELPELERQQRRIRVGGLPVVGAEGVVAAAAEEEGEPGMPTSADLAASLHLIRRALLLMDEVFQNEDLARNYSHPLYLGVMNWCARWAYAPLFRMWWPLLKTMYPQPFTRFLEQQFSLRSVERPAAADGAGEVLEAAVRRGDGGFASDCWGRQGQPTERAGRSQFSYHLRMFYEGRARYEIQAAQVSADADAVPGALLWSAEDFYVPPGLWGVGIGSDFLRALRRPGLDGVRHLVVRISRDGVGPAGHKRAADEMHLYRANGFLEANLVEGRLHVGGEPLAIPEAWAGPEPAESRWMAAAVDNG